MIIPIRTFDKGLWLNAPPDAAPLGTMRRNRGLHTLSSSSFRSRPGSTLLSAFNYHSAFYFSSLWLGGVGTSFYRNGISIRTGLSGDRLSLVRMPPTAGLPDQLFVAGGGSLFKVSSSGSVTNWGISPPADFSGTPIAGGSLTAGTYQYLITYTNSSTGSRSDSNSTEVSVTTSGGNLTASLTLPGASSDSQVDYIEIWRTVMGGQSLFYLDRVADSTATYNDTGVISLSSEELPTDNLIPYSYFDDAFFFNASCFWITRTESGQRGRLFYSPIGRNESVQGFINVSSDDDPLQKIFSWQGMLGVISENHVFQILGENPYISRIVSGASGTTNPFTLSISPYGVLYQAYDGVRVFDGSNTDLASPDGIIRVFQGEDIENLYDFTGVVSAYHKHSYYISDLSQTLSLNLRTGTWRDLGVGVNTFHVSQEENLCGAVIDSELVDFEAANALTDNGTSIPIDIFPPPLRIGESKIALFNLAIIDIDTSGETLAAYAYLDGTYTAIGSVTTSSRSRIELPVGRSAYVVGLHLTGNISHPIELFGIDFDVEISTERTANAATT